MSVFPYSRIFYGPSFTTVISGPHIQVVNTLTGDVLYTTVGQDDALKSGPVRCAAVDKSGKYLATSSDDKLLKLWEIDGLKLLSKRELPKRPTNILFTKDAGTILVSDKFGDVFGYLFEFTPPPTTQKRDALSSHENPSGGQLILGHASLLNAFLLSADEKYIITADRDEHIRVSWYPQGYNIEMYCLGHAKFISAIHNPVFAPEDLISGGGDPVLKIWDWMTGVVKHNLNVWDAVEPYIVVHNIKRKRGEEGEEIPDGIRKGKGKKSKRKGNRQEAAKPGAGSSLETQDPGLTISADSQEHSIEEELSERPPDLKEKVLVIHKIKTIVSNAKPYIIFSAVGATALFSCAYPEDNTAPVIHTLDLGKPVIEFTVLDNDLMWASLDNNWSKDPEGTGDTQRIVRILKLLNGELSEVFFDSPIISALNEKCLIPATTINLKELDIYNHLTTMPKNADMEQETLDTPTADESVPSGKQISKKELGRLKSKQALFAKVQDGIDYRGDVKEPGSKKNKSKHSNDVTSNEPDVLMGDE